jgi:hypothetical protein
VVGLPNVPLEAVQLRLRWRSQETLQQEKFLNKPNGYFISAEVGKILAGDGPGLPLLYQLGDLRFKW